MRSHIKAASSMLCVTSTTPRIGNRPSHLSFPKIPSVRIRAMRQNQRIILRDARIPSAAWEFCRQPVQVAAPA
jgi:hypothetical protein